MAKKGKGDESFTNEDLIALLKAAGFQIEVIQVAPDYLVVERSNLEQIITNAVLSALQAVESTGHTPTLREAGKFATRAVDISIQKQTVLPCQINFTDGRVTAPPSASRN